jgi:hypothetical protein
MLTGSGGKSISSPPWVNPTDTTIANFASKGAARGGSLRLSLGLALTFANLQPTERLTLPDEIYCPSLLTI